MTTPASDGDALTVLGVLTYFWYWAGFVIRVLMNR
jgi:hypothetical protein